MEPSVFNITTRIVFGENAIDGVGEIAREIGGERVLVVTDPHITEVGHAPRAIESLRAAGLTAELFNTVHENPTTVDVEACVEAAATMSADLLVGLGGGSSIDTARGANFLLTNGGRMQDYWGVGKAARPMLPMIAVPTTTGTGSEMQSFALIADPDTHQKMACGDKKAAARVAILDPSLSATQPREVIAHTGMDCIAHAVETAVTRKRTPFSKIFALEAWRLASENFRRILDDASDLEAQGRMLLASACAGIAIEHSMLGAAHAAANPLTAHFNVVHGEAVGMMLPHVVRFNAIEETARAEYAALVRLVDPSAAGLGDDEAAGRLAGCIQGLLADAGMPDGPTVHGVGPEAVEMLAAEAARQWTGRFNPREVTANDFRTLYEAALAD